MIQETLEQFDAHVSDYPSNTEDNNRVIATELLHNLTGRQMKEVLAFLIGLYKDVPNMLNDFWQSSSDACPLEATEQDEQLNKWAKYVYGKCRP